MQGEERLLRELRTYGIYQPPEGLRLVYAVPADEGYYLYDREYGERLPPRFDVKPDGRIESWHGDPVGWSADELGDTGETFNP